MICSGGGSLIVLKMIVTGMTEVRHGQGQGQGQGQG
jgi:hypothetical protein